MMHIYVLEYVHVDVRVCKRSCARVCMCICICIYIKICVYLHASNCLRTMYYKCANIHYVHA